MTPATWKTGRFVELVRIKVSDNAADKVSPAVRSVPWKIWMAEFHARRAEDAISRLVPEDENPQAWGVTQLISEAAPGEQERPLRLAVFEAEADTIACAQATHSLVELFAPIIYEGLGLSSARTTPLLPRQQYPAQILSSLQESGAYPHVADCLRPLLALPSYQYLRAYVNTTKHRTLVPSSYAVSFEAEYPERVHGLRIKEFEYEGQHFGRRWAAEVTTDVRRELREAVVDLGLKLNKALEDAA